MNLQAITEQLKRLWGSLSVRQRVSIGVTVVAVAAGLLTFTRWRSEQDFKPLFTSMSPEDAGSVVRRLKESGVEYRVTGNGTTVLVPSAKVAEARLDLASAGLPKTGRIGFELFDKTNLGTTDFAEQVNFRRALEGEIERSIRSIDEVEQARVHLTFPKDSVFIESRLPAKASVLLRLQPGANVTPANVSAIAHLVASAVDGLTPEAVSVMDVNGNLLSRPNSAQDSGQASDELIAYRQKLEKDLLAKADSTLEPLLGPGRYRIGLSVDCDFSSGEQSDEVYDPEKSVMLTSQKSEETTGAATAGGVPGTASNLPRPPARTGGMTSSVTRRTENISYQSSRTIRRMRLPQGNIRRISASVLLDQASRWEKQGNGYQHVLTPPTPENLRAIRELVAGAIGLVPSRGDQLVVESLPFESTLQSPPPQQPEAAPATPPQNSPMRGLPAWATDWRVLAGAAGVLVLLFGGLLIFRKFRKRRKPKVTVARTPELPANRDAAATLPTPEAGATEALESAGSTAKLLAQAQEKVAQTAKIETLVEELRKSIAEDPSLAASVLRTWIEEVEA